MIADIVGQALLAQYLFPLLMCLKRIQFAHIFEHNVFECVIRLSGAFLASALGLC